MRIKRDKAIELRRTLKLTALDLAEKADLREEKVYQVERGRVRPTADEARRWAKALGVRVKEIFPDLEVEQ